jgi:hypothetical protein
MNSDSKIDFANNILMWFYQQPLSRNLCVIVLSELAVEKHLRQVHFAQADVLQKQSST